MAKETPGEWISNGAGGWYIVDPKGIARPARAYAAELRVDGKEIPPRPKEAEGFRLFTDLQLELFEAGDAGEFRGLSLGQMAKKLGEILSMGKRHG